MKRTFLISTFFILVILSCHHKVIHIDYTGTIESGEYWYTTIDAPTRSFLGMEFQVLSGSTVDIIFADQKGFHDFQERIIVDSLLHLHYDLFPESYAADFYFCNEGEEVVYSYSWAIDSGPPLPIDVFIMDRDNYNFFIQNLPYQALAVYDSVVSVHDTLEIPQDDYIYFIIDNTLLHGSPPAGRVSYFFSLSKLIPAAFSYFSDISYLDYDSVANVFQVPGADTLYLLVNNAGYVENGALPEGPVQFHILVSEE